MCKFVQARAYVRALEAALEGLTSLRAVLAPALATKHGWPLPGAEALTRASAAAKDSSAQLSFATKTARGTWRAVATITTLEAALRKHAASRRNHPPLARIPALPQLATSTSVVDFPKLRLTQSG